MVAAPQTRMNEKTSNPSSQPLLGVFRKHSQCNHNQSEYLPNLHTSTCVRVRMCTSSCTTLLYLHNCVDITFLTKHEHFMTARLYSTFPANTSAIVFRFSKRFVVLLLRLFHWGMRSGRQLTRSMYPAADAVRTCVCGKALSDILAQGRSINSFCPGCNVRNCSSLDST